MLKVLVTYAVQEEFVEIKWPDAECYYVRTGVGKVKSAYYVAEAIRQVQPDLVLNIGTAEGTWNIGIGVGRSPAVECVNVRAVIPAAKVHGAFIHA